MNKLISVHMDSSPTTLQTPTQKHQPQDPNRQNPCEKVIDITVK